MCVSDESNGYVAVFWSVLRKAIEDWHFSMASMFTKSHLNTWGSGRITECNVNTRLRLEFA